MIAFFLGTHPELSLAELRLVFETRETLRYLSVALFDLDEEVVSKRFTALGGVPRYGSVLGTIPRHDNEIERKIQEVLITDLKEESRREYVISLYGVKLDKRSFHHDLKDLLSGVKYDGKFDEPQHAPATSAHVLARGGHEYSLVMIENLVYVIKTKQVQDAKFWSIIDAERPERDMKIGMLPAKLARMMINMSGAEMGGKLWDPFVGLGTVAMQAAFLGIPVHGTDKAQQSIEKSRQNMQWLIKKGLVAQAKHTLLQEPIERARVDRSISAIVTEPFLGKPRFKPFASGVLAQREWKQINRLYGNLLQIAAKTLSSGDRLVMVKPLFSFVARNGREWYNPPLAASPSVWRIPELIQDIGPLIWTHRDSVVGRQIMILEKR